jgi:hypothetical protein
MHEKTVLNLTEEGEEGDQGGKFGRQEARKLPEVRSGADVDAQNRWKSS